MSIEAEKKSLRDRSQINQLSNLLAQCDPSAGEEVVVEGLVVQAADNSKVGDNNLGAMAAIFEDENGVDDDKALATALSYLQKFEFKPSDINFYFNQIEIKMTLAGVKKQYTKLQVLATIIPASVQDEVKSLLSKKETDFPNNNSYKLLKTQILKIFGPNEDAAYEKAISRTLTGAPSQLARQILNDLCEHELEGCCCAKIISGIWKKQLPSAVLQGIAHLKLTKDTFDAVTITADKIYASTKPSGVTVAAVSVAGAPPTSVPSGLSVTEAMNQAFLASGPPTEPITAESIVAAVQRLRGGNRGGGRGNRGGRGQRGGRGNGRGSGRGGQSGNSSGGGGNNSQSRWPGVQRHPDQPPFSCCKKHFRYGKSAHWCEEPATCPWKDYFTPRNN